MRIIAGSAKGKRLKCRKGLETRPTMDRVKEALFSIVGEEVAGAAVLDLFSGTGNIALEAMSRGASRAIMIEADSEALRYIIENVNNLGFEKTCRAYKNDVSRALEILGNKNEKFDIIFMDPPYQDNCCLKVIKKIKKTNTLKEGGIIVCEHHQIEDLPAEIDNYKKVDERKYGKKTLTFYQG